MTLRTDRTRHLLKLHRESEVEKPKPPKPIEPRRDEFSTAQGAALRRKGAHATGTITQVAPTEQTPPATDPAADAQQVQAAWDDELADSGDTALAARAAAQELEALITAHPNDPAYANTLVREANETVEQISVVLGEASEGHDHDKDVVAETISALSNAAAAGGAITALAIGSELAEHVDDDGELHYFDDGFYSHVENGGDPALFQATYQALRAEGKDDAAGKLKDKNGGLLEEATEFAGGLAGDVIGGVTDIAGTLANGAWHVVTETGEFAIDTAAGTIDAATDVASWSADQVRTAAEYAAEQGLELSGALRERVRGYAIDAISGAVDLDAVDDLETGDSWSVGASGWAGYGLGGQAAGEIKVEVKTDPQTGEDQYVVSGMLTGDLGIAAGGNLLAGGEGRVEFTYDNPEDAKAAAQTLISVAAAGASSVSVPGAGLVGAGVLLPGPSELEELRGHLSAIEVTGEIAAELDYQLEGVLGTSDYGGGGEVGGEVSQGYRVELEDGKPVTLTRVTELEAYADWDVDGLLDITGAEGDLKETVSNLTDATASGNIRIEQSIPLDDGIGESELDFLSDPIGIASFAKDDVTTSVTVNGEVKSQGDGYGFSATLDDVQQSDVEAIIHAGGDLEALGEAVLGLEPDWSTTRIHDDRSEVDIDLGAAGVGFEFEAYHQHRDITAL